MTYTFQRIKFFVHEHDELPAFHAAYLLLTFLVAVLLNLGVFAVLVAAHMALDLVKYREVHGYGWMQTVRATFIESVADLMLLSLGTFFAVYLDHGAGVVALAGFLEFEGALARAIALFIPRIEILSHFLHVVSDVRHHLREATVKKRQVLSLGQKLCVITLTACVALTALSPVLLRVESSLVLEILAAEWVPWNV